MVIAAVQQSEGGGGYGGLGLILTGSVFYGTLTFWKKLVFKILVVLLLKTKAKPNCTPPFLLPVNNPLCIQIIHLSLVFMGEH